MRVAETEGTAPPEESVIPVSAIVHSDAAARERAAGTAMLVRRS
jgi:hypothetical protein